MTPDEVKHVTMVTGRLNNELDDERARHSALKAVVNGFAQRSRRHRAQALVFGIILGYAAGVWTALGAQ